MDLRSLKFYMSSKFGATRVDAVFHEIQMIIVRSLQAVQQVRMVCPFRDVPIPEQSANYLMPNSSGFNVMALSLSALF